MEVDIKGLNELLAAFKNQKAAQDILKKATQHAFEVIATGLAVYPERPHRHYVRTFKLRDGWLDAPPLMDFKATSTFGFKAKITNPTPYATAVQGGPGDSEQQEGIHAGIWEVDDEILGKSENAIQDIYEQAAQEIADLF